jgi:hypothetical protein
VDDPTFAGNPLPIFASRRIRPVLLLLLITIMLSSCGTSTSVDRGVRHSISFPISLLIPEGIRVGYDMRDYIASPEFGAFDSIAPPEQVFDEIYFESLALTHGDLSEALLAASFGSFEHEYIPLDFFGAEVDLPLTSETHARFLLRVSHLPEHLYHIPEGDRDKLQHFFASAWLKSLLGMDWLVRLAGEGVEAGEGAFVIGDSRDPRDVHANGDGLKFEMRTEQSPDTRPSKSLTPNPPVSP